MNPTNIAIKIWIFDNKLCNILSMFTKKNIKILLKNFYEREPRIHVVNNWIKFIRSKETKYFCQCIEGQWKLVVTSSFVGEIFNKIQFMIVMYYI